MIVTLAAVTVGIAVAAVAVVVGGLVLLVRLLEFLDVTEDGASGPGGEERGGGGPGGDDAPPWWPDFERQLAAYLTSSWSAASR